MGKSKQRILARARNNKYPLEMTREKALKIVCEELNKNPSGINAKNIISLFGLKAEELSENGISYEILRSLDGLLN